MTARESAPRLGRGLASLLGETAPNAAQDSSVQLMSITALRPSPFQPRTRIDQAALSELSSSIRERGILQPLLVRPTPGADGQYQIIAGERRWRAAELAGLEAVPVLLRTLSDADAMAAALVENLQRQDLDPIEEAEGYRRLIDEFGLTQERLGEAVGKSRSHIANAMRLLNLPPEVRTELQSGVLSAGHARALLAHPDPAMAARQVIARGLNVRQTETLAQAASQRRDRAPRTKSRDPETVELERSLTERLGLKVAIQFDGAGGSIRIQYRTLEQLDGLLALLNRD